jgi:hypothetical protein
VFKFIFRLACFAILLYLVLVKFHLSPWGAVVGLTMPVFIMAAVVLAMVNSIKHDDEYI